jgi:hypothetical protein
MLLICLAGKPFDLSGNRSVPTTQVKTCDKRSRRTAPSAWPNAMLDMLMLMF